MHTHLEFELARARVVEMRREIERNRLESRLAEAHEAKDVLPKEIGPVSREMDARAMEVHLALFR